MVDESNHIPHKNMNKDELVKRIEYLEKKIELIHKQKFINYVDEYIDKWYDENKEDVDLGNIKIFGLWNVDIISDDIEKHLYKKAFKIMYSLITDLKK